MMETYPQVKNKMKYMLSLFEDLNLNIDEYLQAKGIDDIDSLTGGMDGTASEIIGELVNKVPRTDKQAEAIQSMGEFLRAQYGRCYGYGWYRIVGYDYEERSQ